MAAPTEEPREHKLAVLQNLLRAGQLDQLLEALDLTRNGNVTHLEGPQ